MSPTHAASDRPFRALYWLPPAVPGDLPLLRAKQRPTCVPVGYRVAANGFDLELVAHPAWPTHPFNRFCQGRTMPNDALLFEARFFMPEFAPEQDPLAWRTLEEFIRVWTRRSDEQLAQMTQEEMTATLRAYRLQQRDTLRCGAPNGRPTQEPNTKRGDGGQQPEKNVRVNERLLAFAATNLRDAIELPLEGLGKRIGCKKSAFSRSEFYNKELKPLRENRSRRGKGAECFDAEERQSKRNYDAAGTEREATDRRVDAEMASSRR